LRAGDDPLGLKQALPLDFLERLQNLFLKLGEHGSNPDYSDHAWLAKIF
jgi:hypothetical protein